MNYDRGSSTIFKLCVVVAGLPQLNILYMVATHPSLQDYEPHDASRLSSSDDDVLGHAVNWGGR